MAIPLQAQIIETVLPKEIAGYRADGPDEVADADGLFKLIDGGAEVYRALNVSRVLERRYVKLGQPDIVVDVFDMGSSEDAYGAYHHDMREAGSAGIGQESELQGNNLTFWKGRFYVALVPLRASPAVREAVLAIGRAIERKLPASGQPPGLARLLPAPGLIASQVHYFHDWPLLSRLAFLSGENPLQLDRETEGLLARYQLGASGAGEPPALLLVRYPTAARALAAFRTAQGGLEPGESGRRPVLKLADRVLAAVLDSPSDAAAQQLLNRIPFSQGAKP